MREQRASHSSILCDVNNIAQPLSLIAVSTSQICRLAFGSIPAVGSSSNIKRACDINAIPRLKRRFCPPLKSRKKKNAKFHTSKKI